MITPILTILSLAIPIMFLFAYSVFFALEIAAVFQMSWHKQMLTTHGVENAKIFSIAPIWELTNVFLIFALVAAMAFFPGAIMAWAPSLAIPALVFLTVQAFRVSAAMIIIHGKPSGHKRHRFAHHILAIATMLTPSVLFGGFLPTFLIGQSAFSSGGWALGLAIGIIAIATSIITALAFLMERDLHAHGAHNHDRRGGGFAWFWIAVLASGWTLGTSWVFRHSPNLPALMADPSTLAILLPVCAVGLVITIPGMALLYSWFL